jgi:predicted nuclease of predicted toxin-antitoxin system
MKLLVDMNLSPRWVGLTKAGFEAVHWSNVGAANASDTEIMRYASTHDYVVLTMISPSAPSSSRPVAADRAL